MKFGSAVLELLQVDTQRRQTDRERHRRVGGILVEDNRHIFQISLANTPKENYVKCKITTVPTCKALSL
jgi:hypothetical protein